MAKLYTVTLDNITIANSTGDMDILEITPADDKPIELLGWELAVTSETGDAAEEFLRCKIIRGHATSGSGGSAPTPRPLDTADAAAFTVEVGNGTIASAGTGIDLWGFGINERIPHPFGPVPDGFGFRCSQADTLLVVRIMNTVADDVSITGGFWIREL